MVSVTVNAVNDAPVAANDTASTNEDTAVAIDVLGNDTAGPANESAQTIAVDSITIAPDHGTAVVISSGPDAGKVLYTPAADYNGSDSFTYKVCDDGTPSLCDTAVVSVTVNAVNDAPVNTVPGAQTTNEDTAKTINGISVADLDVAETLGGEFKVTIGVTNGTLTLAATTGLTFTTGDGTGRRVDGLHRHAGRHQRRAERPDLHPDRQLQRLGARSPSPPTTRATPAPAVP